MGKYAVILCLLLFATVSEAATIVAGRTSGTAPLLVNFYDSEATASTSVDGVFHSREYTWTYGDTEAGSWGTSGLSKNTDKGPVAAHVFETAGTYTVTLTVKNSSGEEIGTDTETITVADPDTTYTGTLTTCVNKVGDDTWTGCPSGASHVNSDDLTSASVINAAQTGERLLLKRGSSWTLSGLPAWPNSTGPTTIGAYGTCTTPDALGICSNAPAISGSSGFIDIGYNRDFRIMDLAYTGEFTGGSNLTDFDQCLFLRLNISNAPAGAGLGWSHWNSASGIIRDQLGVVSSRVYNSAHYGVYVGGERLAVLGNIFNRTGDTHLLRVWQLYRGVIAHNQLTGTNYNSAEGRSALKLHGPDDVTEDPEHCAETAGTACLRNYTALSVVSNNTFGGSGPYPVGISPQSAAADTQITDIIFEKNRIIDDYGESYTNQTRSLLLGGRYFSVRNNIIDGSSANFDWRGIVIGGTGVTAEDYPQVPGGLGYHMIYNNTIYRSDSPNDTVYGVDIRSGSTTSTVRNNLFSAPSATGDVGVSVNNGTGTTLSNNVDTDTPYFSDPNNATPLSRSYALTASSTAAIDQGYTTPLIDDYLGNCRIGENYDVGAYEYGASSCDAFFSAVLPGGNVVGGVIVH